MEGRLRPLGSQEKRDGYALLQEKKKQLCLYNFTTLSWIDSPLPDYFFDI